MTLTFREAQPRDIPEMFALRGGTRENPITIGELALLGITPELTTAAMTSGRSKSWVCLHGSSLVGFATGDSVSGEVLVLAVHPDFERRGIGRRLLMAVVEALRYAGCDRIWLAASADSAVRSHGFYRHLGWQSTGEATANGDEILECTPDYRWSGRDQ
jgi:ribosomal protein S18 acetylase RimI-like enzyme